MGFRWRFLDEADRDVGRSEAFPDREAAEAWMAQSWSGLNERDVQDVELIDEDGGAPLYRMSLSESQE